MELLQRAVEFIRPASTAYAEKKIICPELIRKIDLQVYVGTFVTNKFIKVFIEFIEALCHRVFC